MVMKGWASSGIRDDDDRGLERGKVATYMGVMKDEHVRGYDSNGYDWGVERESTMNQR